MAVQSDEHQRTMQLADAALGRMKALGQPVLPQNYEIWYAYAAGQNPTFNQTIDDLMTRGRPLSAAFLNEIYQTFFSPSRLSERIETVGAKVALELQQIVATIDQAVGTNSSYTERLLEFSRKLVTADREALRAILTILVRSARELEQANTALEARLKASKDEISHLKERVAKIRQESLTDPLTGLANRKGFDQALDRAVAEARTGAEHLCLVMIDIDHFKDFNDSFGHMTGDQVLQLVAEVVKQNVKRQDMAARHGGEEFAIILPKASLRHALTVADHIRRAVGSKELIKRATGETLGRVTVSAGVAALHGEEPVELLIERADSCLRLAKCKGRNLVTGESDAKVKPVPARRVA